MPLRSLSTTAPVFASKKSSKGKGKEKKIINPDAMPLDEAVRVLRALEIANPSSSYTIEIKCKDQKVLLRGRVQLPSDPRKTADVIVVFAEPGSPSEEAAKKAGATIVGGAELFPKILSGEIAPTKVLSATGMLPSVSRNLARFLGPKNLMPTVKRGNVGDGAELARMIKEAGGALDFRADKEGLVKSREWLWGHKLTASCRTGKLLPVCGGDQCSRFHPGST